MDPADCRGYGPDIRKCFGSSAAGKTRISFPYLEPDDFALTVITNSLGSVSFRAQAPEVLRSILSSRHFIKLQYWKKADRSLYYETPLGGACGHYALSQVHSRQYDAANQLQLGTSIGRHRAAEILEALAQAHLLPTTTGQETLSTPFNGSGPPLPRPMSWTSIAFTLLGKTFICSAEGDLTSHSSVKYRMIKSPTHSACLMMIRGSGSSFSAPLPVPLPLASPSRKFLRSQNSI